jgi:hypothetical protein
MCITGRNGHPTGLIQKIRKKRASDAEQAVLMREKTGLNRAFPAEDNPVRGRYPVSWLHLGKKAFIADTLIFPHPLKRYIFCSFKRPENCGLFFNPGDYHPLFASRIVS